jgi:hypothetical protein
VTPSVNEVFSWVWGLTGEPHFHSTIILLGLTWLSSRTNRLQKRVEAQDVTIGRLQRQMSHLLNVIGMRKHESLELGAYLPLPSQTPRVAGPDLRRKVK